MSISAPHLDRRVGTHPDLSFRDISSPSSSRLDGAVNSSSSSSNNNSNKIASSSEIRASDAPAAVPDTLSTAIAHSSSSLSATEKGALMSSHMARVHQTPPSPHSNISDISGVPPSSSSYPTYVHRDGNTSANSQHLISSSSTLTSTFSIASLSNSSLSATIIASSSLTTSSTTNSSTSTSQKHFSASSHSTSLRRRREEDEDEVIHLMDPDRRTHSMELNVGVSSIAGGIGVGMTDAEIHSINRPNKRPRLLENEDTKMRSVSPPSENVRAAQQQQQQQQQQQYSKVGNGKAVEGSSPISTTPVPAYASRSDTRALSVGGSSNSNISTPTPITPSSITSKQISRDVSMSSPLPGRSSLPPLPHTPTHHPHSSTHSHQHHGYEEGDLILRICSSNNGNNMSGTNACISSFKVHAGRLVLNSRAFASLLTTPISSPAVFSGPGGPKASARAAAEIGAKLAQRRRGTTPGNVNEEMRDSMMTEEEVRSEIEYVDQCPLIVLDGDSPKDWSVVLDAIYEPMSFQIRPVIFEALAGVLRIATKYEFDQLRSWAVNQLRSTWPPSLDHMAPLALPHAADAIALARQCNVPEILPAAFYALAVQRWRPAPSRPCSFSGSATSSSSSSPNQANAGRNFASGTDGGRAHAVLDPMDMRRLVMGREALQDVLVEFVAAPLSITPCMLPEAEIYGNGTMIVSLEGSTYWSSGAESKESSAQSGNRSEKAAREDGGKHVYPPSPSPSPTPSRKSTQSSGSGAGNGNGVSDKVPSINLGPATPATSPIMETFPTTAGRSVESWTSPAKAVTTSASSSSTPSSNIPTFSFCPSTGPDASTCRNALEALWRARLTPDPRRAWGTWLVRELHRLATLPRAAAFCAVVMDSPLPGDGNKMRNYENGGGYGVNGNGCGGYSEYNRGAIGECQYQYQRYQYQQWKVDDGSGTGSGSGSDSACPVCKRCWEENRKLVLWRLDWLCAVIPGMFML